MRETTGSTICRMLGACAALVVCLGAYAPSASAEMTHDSLWGADSSSASGSCVNHGILEHEGFVSLMSQGESSTAQKNASEISPAIQKQASLASDCLADSDGSKRSNNLCFEKSGVPASVVPQLLAKSRALEQSENVVDVARAIVDAQAGGSDRESETRRVVASRKGPVGTIPPSQPNPKSSCTAQPDNCRSLPPVPPSLDVEASGAAPQLPDESPEFSESDDPADEVPAGSSRVGPSDGHASPPLKPPRT